MASSHSSSQKNEEYHASSSVASSSSSHAQGVDRPAFSGIVPSHCNRKGSEPSRLYDVFINHRGPDVKYSLAFQLYDSLKKLGIQAYLDSEEKELGESFPLSIEAAICSAAVHIAIFSKGYADSPWCLAELVLMLKTRAKIIPLFYGVEPSALRRIEEGQYAAAFVNYKNKNRYPEKIKEWKEALQSVSFIAGEVNNSFSDSECEKIVSVVQKEVEKINRPLKVATHPVGFPKLVEEFEKQCMDKLVQDFEGQCGMNKQREGKAKIVGIFGMGGVGKTTLSKAYFNGERSSFQRSCFLFDVREASVKNDLPSLQMKLLRDLFNETAHPGFSSVEEGTGCLRSCFRRSSNSSFLIVLDDIDNHNQLDALLFSDELNKSFHTLVIVTTRDVGVLINAGIRAAYHMKGMDRVYAKELFCWHAFSQANPSSGYERLVDLFVDMCGGLPLSLQVLGRHVHGRDEEFWELQLQKVQNTLPPDIHNRLRISIDTLDNEEKQIFMDIACFFVGETERDAINVWKATGWNAQVALWRLIDKCLVERVQSDVWCVLRMHDHLRDLGRAMSDEVKDPRRLWRSQHLQHLISKGLANIFTKSKARCLVSFSAPSKHFDIKFFLDESDSLLWLRLNLRGLEHTNIPAEIPLQNLHFLRITKGILRKLWPDEVQVPFLLKELQMYAINLLKLNLSPLRNLEKVMITYCDDLKIVTGIADLAKLIEFNITDCKNLKEFGSNERSDVEKCRISASPCLKNVAGLSDLRKQVKLNIKNCKQLEKINFVYLSCLEKITISDCNELQSLEGTSYLTKLVELQIARCPRLDKISFDHLGCLKELTISNCKKLESLVGTSDLRELVELHIAECQYLQKISFDQLSCLKKIKISDCYELQSLVGTSYLRKLVELRIAGCPKLEELSFVELNCLEIIMISGCFNLRSVTLFHLNELAEFNFNGCGPIEELSLAQVSFLEKIRDFYKFYPKGIEVEGCEKESSFVDLKNVKLNICDCRKLSFFPQSSGLRALMMVILNEIPLSRTHIKLTLQCCRALQTVAGMGDFTDCPELQFDKLCFGRLSWLEIIEIDSCEKMEKISGIERLHSLERLQLLYCSKETIQSCIRKMKKLPSDFTQVIGRPIDGAESTLNGTLFSDANICFNSVIEFGSDDTCNEGYATAIILCAVLVINTSDAAKQINASMGECDCNPWQKFEMRQGKWIITSVTTNQDEVHSYILNKGYIFPFEYFLFEDATVRKGYKMTVTTKKSEEHQILNVVRKIVDLLYL